VIQESDLSKRKRALLHEVVNWSFARGREWAVFEKLDDLVALTGIHRPDVANAIAELQREQLVQRKTARGELWIRFLPHGALAPAPSKIDGVTAAAVRQKLESLNSMPEGFEPSTGQRKLALPPAAEDQVENELAANSQASAIRRSEAGDQRSGSEARVSESLTDLREKVSESLTKSRELVSETLTTGVSESLTARDARGRARATCHDHGTLPTAKHEHDHVHAPAGGGEEGKELSADRLDLLNQVEELTEGEGRTEHFATTWRMRVTDHPIAVFKAVGEVRVAKREGRIRLSVGGALNWHFKNFREAMRKGARMLFC
jgi:hypothetical protein